MGGSKVLKKKVRKTYGAAQESVISKPDWVERCGGE